MAPTDTFRIALRHARADPYENSGQRAIARWRETFTKLLVISGIVITATFAGAWIIHCVSAQGVEFASPVVDVYRLEGVVPNDPPSAASGKAGLPSLDRQFEDAAARGSAGPAAIGKALQAIATRRGVRERLDVRALITQEFEQYDRDYRAHKGVRERRLDELKRKLLSAEEGGKAIGCSQRMVIEAEWLLHYTAEWSKLDQQLAAAKRSLAMNDQGVALRQMPDGSWGACYRAWFEKIDGTVDFLTNLRRSDDGGPPGLQYSFEILRGIDNSEILIPHLYGLQLSQIARTGIYRRKELNALEGALSQFLFKDQLRALLRANGAAFIDDAYVDAYRRFLDDTQDPILGYWGPWIMSGDQIIRTADLSQTYHAVAYRKGIVNSWRQIIETTFAMKDLEYPFGWRHRGQFDNHNNYDVISILHLGWPYMTSAEKDQARTEIRAMLKWALGASLTPDGQFREDLGFYDSAAEADYYGVSFLVEAGYWDKDRRFWDGDPTHYADAEDVCRKIRGHLVRLQTNSITAQDALTRLNQSCQVGNSQ